MLVTESLRPRTTAGKAVTNIHSKTNWSNWSAGVSASSSQLDTMDPPSQNTTTPSSVSSLSSLDNSETDNNNILFPELEVPPLDFKTPWLEFKPRPHYLKTEPFSSVAAAPDYKLNKFFALALITQPKVTMPMETP
ncbi:hypothetical protein CY34DRAFT_13813 [Suillus luteus UH-Slu-Lm8-n1]|uniref:Uncharacterized protein n=1 Tax=Suillus luteus UH-Slu-Lm8-n1 TaxID=930992 RepID=A0A0D0AEZ6_9AGAM|nr:hypothetical protein CY34DRAFT_13813 [Suillus luteus UH-Slu-Lm8-n1]